MCHTSAAVPPSGHAGGSDAHGRGLLPHRVGETGNGLPDSWSLLRERHLPLTGLHEASEHLGDAAGLKYVTEDSDHIGSNWRLGHYLRKKLEPLECCDSWGTSGSFENDLETLLSCSARLVTHLESYPQLYCFRCFVGYGLRSMNIFFCGVWFMCNKVDNHCRWSWIRFNVIQEPELCRVVFFLGNVTIIASMCC